MADDLIERLREIKRLRSLLAQALPMLRDHKDYADNAPVWHCTGWEAPILAALIPKIEAALKNEQSE